MEWVVMLVGGPFDGEKGMGFTAEDPDDLPDVIRVGRCPGNGLCGFPQCVATRRSHVSYWTPEDVDWHEILVAVTEYHQAEAADLQRLVAVYVHGDVNPDAWAQSRALAVACG